MTCGWLIVIFWLADDLRIPLQFCWNFNNIATTFQQNFIMLQFCWNFNKISTKFQQNCNNIATLMLQFCWNFVEILLKFQQNCNIMKFCWNVVAMLLKFQQNCNGIRKSSASQKMTISHPQVIRKNSHSQKNDFYFLTP